MLPLRIPFLRFTADPATPGPGSLQPHESAATGTSAPRAQAGGLDAAPVDELLRGVDGAGDAVACHGQLPAAGHSACDSDAPAASETSRENGNGHQPGPESSSETSSGGEEEKQRMRSGSVSHFDAKRLLTACYMAEDYYDLIDVDPYGSESSQIGPALDALRHGGMLFLTSTDYASSAGALPQRRVCAPICCQSAIVSPYHNDFHFKMRCPLFSKKCAVLECSSIASAFHIHGTNLPRPCWNALACTVRLCDHLPCAESAPPHLLRASTSAGA